MSFLPMQVKITPAMVIHGAVFLGLAGLVALPGVTATASMIMILAGLLLVCRRSIRLPHGDQANRWILAMSLLPMAYLVNMAWFGWEWPKLENPSKMLLAILIFLAIREWGLSSRTAILGCFVGAIIAGIVSAYQSIVLDLAQAHGYMWHIPFGNFSLLLAFLSLLGVLYTLEHRGRHKGLILAIGLMATVAGLMASAASGARGGWIAIPILGLILVTSLSHVRFKFYAVLVIIISLPLIYQSTPIVKQRVDLATHEIMHHLQNKPDNATSLSSLGTRLEMWRYGMNVFVQHPVMGVGIATFEEQARQDIEQGLTNPGILGQGSMRHHHLHNDAITILARMGLVGFLAWVMFWILSWSFFTHGLRAGKQHHEASFFSWMGLLTLSGIFMFSLSDSMLGTSAGTLCFVFLLATAAGGLSYHARKTPENS
ncbi:MAG: O-antigen ligase family protein [Halothiobacillaceae bacterium]|nr:MAG: O-antigen ligase family protein [Halothiobacillaceae bacterium]